MAPPQAPQQNTERRMIHVDFHHPQYFHDISCCMIHFDNLILTHEIIQQILSLLQQLQSITFIEGEPLNAQQYDELVATFQQRYQSLPQDLQNISPCITMSIMNDMQLEHDFDEAFPFLISHPSSLHFSLFPPQDVVYIDLNDEGALDLFYQTMMAI
jgi:hypothetical protein